MIDVRSDLIQKEFEKGCTQGLAFRRLKPSNRFIDWLFRHYYVHEHTEHFYDSEPDFDDFEELEQAYKKITKQIEDYKSHKIEFNNWIEPYFKGNWGMSQTTVDRIARRHLESTKKCSVSYNNRLFITEKEDSIFIYYYGRDFAELDYWWIFKKKPTKKNHKRKR